MSVCFNIFPFTGAATSVSATKPINHLVEAAVLPESSSTRSYPRANVHKTKPWTKCTRHDNWERRSTGARVEHWSRNATVPGDVRNPRNGQSEYDSTRSSRVILHPHSTHLKGTNEPSWQCKLFQTDLEHSVSSCCADVEHFQSKHSTTRGSCDGAD